MFAVSVADPRATEVATTTTSPAQPRSVVAADLAAGTTAPTTPEGLGVGVAPEVRGRTPLPGFGEATVTITSGDGSVCTLCVLSAITVDQRARGLMEVTDKRFGGYDGMLFEFPGEVSGAFWMRNTPTPLSIAYFDAKGDLVSGTDMQPCGDSPDCPSYPAKGDFQYALEVPQGMLDEAGAVGAATLRIDARTCPLASAGG